MFFCPGKRQEDPQEIKAQRTFSSLDGSHTISGGNQTYFLRLLLIAVGISIWTVTVPRTEQDGSIKPLHVSSMLYLCWIFFFFFHWILPIEFWIFLSVAIHWATQIMQKNKDRSIGALNHTLRSLINENTPFPLSETSITHYLISLAISLDLHWNIPLSMQLLCLLDFQLFFKSLPKNY